MSLFQVTVHISLRKDILDPAGRATEKSLQSMGFNAANTRIGKTVSLAIEADNAEIARAETVKMADQLLANPVMEDYTISVSDS